MLSLREENNTNSDSLFVYYVVCSVKEIGVQTSEGDKGGQAFVKRYVAGHTTVAFHDTLIWGSLSSGNDLLIT